GRRMSPGLAHAARPPRRSDARFPRAAQRGAGWTVVAGLRQRGGLVLLRLPTLALRREAGPADPLGQRRAQLPVAARRRAVVADASLQHRRRVLHAPGARGLGRRARPVLGQRRASRPGLLLGRLRALWRRCADADAAVDAELPPADRWSARRTARLPPRL